MSISNMSNKTERQLRFEILKAEALSTTCETFKNLPQLYCNECRDVNGCARVYSFGGIETFKKEIFTEWDICLCSSPLDED
jgi:hypothetical protein